MTGEEPDVGKNATTSTPRTIRHQQRFQMLVRLYDLALARRPDLAQELGQEIAGLLASNPSLDAAFCDLFQARSRAPVVPLADSVALATVLNGRVSVLNTPASVLNTPASVLNGGPDFVEAASDAPRLPPPLSALSPSGKTNAVPKPPPQRKTSAPTGLTREMVAMQGDAHWQAFERVLGRVRSSTEWENRFAAVEAARDSGLSPQEILQIGHNWKRKLSFGITAQGMVRYAGQALNGPDLGEQRHNQTVTDVGTRFHEESFSQMEARRGIR